MRKKKYQKITTWISFIIASLIFLGIIWLVDWKINKDIYEPRCWIKNDDIGIDIRSGEEAIKQYPIRCKYFK